MTKNEKPRWRMKEDRSTSPESTGSMEDVADFKSQGSVDVDDRLEEGEKIKTVDFLIDRLLYVEKNCAELTTQCM